MLASSERAFLVVTADPLEGDSNNLPNTIQDYPTPFFYYIVPFSASSGILDAENLGKYLSNNPKVLSITMVQFLPFMVGGTNNTSFQYTGNSANLYMYRLSGAIDRYLEFDFHPDKFNGVTIPETYEEFQVGVLNHWKYESKLLCYPYSYNMLTDFQAQPLILKNEYLTENRLQTIASTQCLSHNMKARYWVSSGYCNEWDG
jgi:hypothetical protein